MNYDRSYFSYSVQVQFLDASNLVPEILPDVYSFRKLIQNMNRTHGLILYTRRRKELSAHQ
jgi:hypothetical protein